MRLCINSLAIVIITFQSLFVNAQSEFSKVEKNNYACFTNYYKSDGICSYEFTDIIQDCLGLMWFATHDGLMRFDGSHFKTYVGGNSKGQLPHSYVSSLALDKQKNLWVGTKEGLCIYRPLSDSFERVDSLFGLPLQGHRWVKDIYVDSKGRLWVDRHNGTLNCIDFNNKTVETFQHEYLNNDIYHFHAITEFGDGVMLGGGSTQLTWLTRNPDKWNTYPDGKTIINNKIITVDGTANFYDDGSDYIWLANFGDNAYLINKKTLERIPLPLPSVYTICPSGDGKVWMGGYHFGAVLYNPSTNSAVRFIRNEGNPQSLAGNMIWFIYRDNQGNTWFGTDNGLSMLSAFANRSIHLQKIADANSLPSNQITCMLTDYPKGIWLGTKNKGLAFYNYGNQLINRYGYFNSPDSIGSNWVTAIAKTTDNTLLITLWNGRDGGFNRFWIDKKRFQRFNADNYYWYSNTITTSDGLAFVASWGFSIHQFNPALNRFTQKKFNIFEHLISNASGFINKINSSLNGWIYFNPTTLLNTYDKDTLTIYPKYFDGDFGIPQGKRVVFNFQTNIKDALFYQNTLYILGTDGKIYPFNLKARKFEKPLPSKNPFNAISTGKYLYAIAPSNVYRWRNNTFEEILNYTYFPQVKTITDLDSRIYLGTLRGLYLKPNAQDNPIKIDDGVTNSLITYKNLVFAATSNGVAKIIGDKVVKRYLNGENITCINVDSTGTLWISNTEGLYWLTIDGDILQPVKAYPASKDSLPSTQVKSISTDALGDTWILSDVCVSKYLTREKRYESYYEPGKSAIQTNLTYKMFEDSQGYVWVGFTRNGVGVDRINTKTRTIKHYPHLPYDSTSYPNTSITYCIFEDADGNMLFGTDKGLAILPPGSEAFRLIDTKHGLPSPVVTAVYQDRLRNYWIGTDKGVVRYSKKLKKVDIKGSQFGFKDELVTAIDRWGFDTLAVSGNFGVYLFNPYVPGNEIPPQNIKIISCITDYDTLANFPDPNSKIYIKASHKWLDIQFTATDYTYPGKLEYTYWLEGFEDSINAHKTFTPIAHYTNLPYGKYTFMVYYSRPDGTTSPKPVSIQFVVGLPFYFKPWFFIVFLTLIGIIVYIYEVEKVKRVKRKRDELELAVIEKTKEIISQNEELKSQAELIKHQSNSLRLKTYQINESLEFSKLLQTNLMPGDANMAAILGEYFLMYKPKDVVSGDFYWLKGNPEEFTLIIADCTGHGVHGGFVSMMGITLLNETYTHSTVKNPVDLIVELNNHFTQTIGNELQAHASSMAVEMEISVCMVNRKDHTVKFAGTHSPLYHLKRNENSANLEVYKSGGKAVGNRWFTPNIPMVEVTVEKGDGLIVATDGLFDQLSEVDKKRFGRKQFEKLLLENTNGKMDVIQGLLEQSYEAWRGNAQQIDDITIVGFMI